MALVQHHPSADTAYQPGRDVHGKYVPPADLPAGDSSLQLPDKVQFDVRVNPLAYGAGQGSAPKYANTQMPVAHVEVDLNSGDAKLNGKPLTSAQDQAVLEACRKAGYR